MREKSFIVKKLTKPDFNELANILLDVKWELQKRKTYKYAIMKGFICNV